MFGRILELAETKIKQQGYTDINFTLSYIMLLGNTLIVDAAECCTHLTGRYSEPCFLRTHNCKSIFSAMFSVTAEESTISI